VAFRSPSEVDGDGMVFPFLKKKKKEKKRHGPRRLHRSTEVGRMMPEHDQLALSAATLLSAAAAGVG